MQVPQWRKCDAPAVPRCLEPHLSSPVGQVPRSLCPGTKVHGVGVRYPGGGSFVPRAERPGRNRCHEWAVPAFSALQGSAAKTSNLESFRQLSSSFPLTLAFHPVPSPAPVLTTPRPHPHTRKHTQQQAASSADTSDLITSYEPLWCRLIPSYECLLVGLQPSSSNLPVQMTWPSGRGLLPSFETDLATWYGLDRLRSHGLSRMALLT